MRIRNDGNLVIYRFEMIYTKPVIIVLLFLSSLIRVNQYKCMYVPNISIDRDRHRESLIIFHDQDSTSATVSRKDRCK